MNKKIYILGIILIVFFLLTLEGGEDYKRNNEIDIGKVENWENGMRTSGAKDSFEWWYLDGILDDGTKLAIVFNTRPYVLVNVLLPEGKGYSKLYKGAKDEFSASRKTCNVSIGKNYFRGDLNNYEMYVDIEDLKIDLNMQRTVPSWKRGGEQEFIWLVPAPRGNISGTFTLGEEKKEFTGAGYHDHSWKNRSMTSLENILDHWYWGRAHFNDYTIVFTEIVSKNKANSAKRIYIAKGNEVLVSDFSKLKITESNFEIHPLTKRKIANNLKVLYKNQRIEILLTLNREEDISVLGLEGDAQKLSISEDFKGAYHRFTGEGKFEIIINGEKEFHEGEAIWETMIFNEDVN